MLNIKKPDFTPGPWEWQDWSDENSAELKNKNHLVSKNLFNSRTFPSLPQELFCLNDDIGDYYHGESNAKLIATAPELAEALLERISDCGCLEHVWMLKHRFKGEQCCGNCFYDYQLLEKAGYKFEKA